MTDLIALIALMFGCGQLIVTGKAFQRINKDKKNQKKTPKFTKLSLGFGSIFGLLLVFLSLDMVFKWI